MGYGITERQVIQVVAEALIKFGKLSADQLSVAKDALKNMGGESLADILIQKKFVSEKDLLKQMGKSLDIPVMNLSSYQPDPQVIKQLSPAQASKWQVLPLFEVEGKLSVATADPLNLEVLDEVRTALDKEVDAMLASPAEIEQAIRKYYGEIGGGGLELGSTKGTAIEVVRYEGEMGATEDSLSPLARLEAEAEGEKTVQAVNQMLAQAYQERASDLHLEPVRQGLKVRMRVDGALHELKMVPKRLHQPVISRIKIMGNMDVAEQRVPQDGRVRVKISGKEMDLRIASYPTIFGEAVAIRLLIKDQLFTMADLGFIKGDDKLFKELIHRPHGIFLVTGPTGSGKSTTLYAALQNIDRQTKHVMSIEDPVEHEIEGVDQQQVNEKAGMTFANALRGMLRQDPDVIMVGEIRDFETADVAIRAAMTGHLIFSTLHTNTAVGAVTRLVDLGVERFLISSTVIGVMAQRLVRRLCQKCRQPAPIPEAQRDLLGHLGTNLTGFQPKGCRDCRMLGYRGRVGLFEIMKVDDEMRVLITTKASETRMQEKFGVKGLRTLLEDGLEKVRLGMTTLDEVLQVTFER